MAVHALAITGTLAAAACMPVLPHPPYVESGPSEKVTVGHVFVPCDTWCVLGEELVGAASWAFGMVPGDPSRPALRLGATIPFGFLFPFASADVHVQVPPLDGELVYAGGVTVSYLRGMAYGQVGWISPEGAGLYVTAGYVRGAITPGSGYSLETDVGSLVDPLALYWLPGLSWVGTFRDRGFQIQAMAPVGRAFRLEEVEGASTQRSAERHPFAGLYLSISLEHEFMRAPPQRPAPPPRW